MAENKRAEAVWKRMLQYFFQGVVVLAPVGITLYVVIWLFRTVDNILPEFLFYFFPGSLMTKPGTVIRLFPGLGFLAVICTVIIIGRLSSSFIAVKILDALDHVLQRTPGLKFIYSSVKDILKAFTGNKKKFDRPVLANVDASDVWRIGFITQETATNFDMPQHAVVYIPLAYSITGITYVVPKKNIILVPNITSAEAMKLAVSGGLADVD